MSLRDDIVRVAREQIGAEYDTRASYPWYGPASDYDSFNCSGLVRAVYDQCGVTIPGFQRASIGDSQSRWVMDAGHWHWDTDGLQPGDLVFWQDGDDWTDTYHVGIYVGDDMCVSANGPRMGVCEHSVWIDSNFIGGGWPLDWTDGWDEPQEQEQQQDSQIGVFTMAANWAIVGDEGGSALDMGSKVVSLEDEEEQRFMEWYIQQCIDQQRAGVVPHVGIYHDRDGLFQKGAHFELLLEITSRPPLKR